MTDITDTKAYKKVLQHRKTCKLWGKGFCLDCFGGGLTAFLKELEDEHDIIWWKKEVSSRRAK